jgi:putative membrane protein insertion efficiency factor
VRTVFRALSWLVAGALLALLAAYRAVISPVLHALSGPGAGCRFHPTCSEYAAESIRIHGPIRGTWRALGRLGRCHPLHAGGYDPVIPDGKESLHHG